MADGIRIQPQPARLKALGMSSAAHMQIDVRDRSRPIAPHPQNPVCHLCEMAHEFKTYHFMLDAAGTTIVSTTIWDRLLAMPDHGGFEMVNVVADPPTQGIVLTP